MAQQVEIAQLYYTLGARADAGTQAVVAEQSTVLDQLEEQARAAGVPVGALRAAVVELTDEVERELKAAVAALGKQMDASGISAAVLAKQTEAVAEASAESLGALSAQVRLYGQGAQIAGTRQQSLTQLAGIEQLLKGRLDQGNLSLEQRIRLEAVLAQTQVTLVGATARATNAVTAMGRTTQGAGESIKVLGSRWSGTALQVVTAASSIVQSGNVSAGSLKSVLLGATSLAGFLGAGGALVVAAAVAANAIIGVFTKAREEARKTADETREEIARLQNAGDSAALVQRAQTLFEGTAAGGYKDGIRALRAELAALDQQIASAGVFGQLDAKTKEERARVAKTLQGLEEDFARTREAIENPARAGRAGPQAIRVTATSPEGDAERRKRSADATAQGAAAFRDVRQAVEDLVGSVRGGESVLTAFDRKVREIEDAFAKLKNPTREQAAEFAQLQASAAAARQTLATITGRQAAAELRKIEAALTPSVLDEMTIATQELRDRLIELKAPPEVAQRILELKQALDDASTSGTALDERLDAIATSGAGPLRQMIALGELRREKEAELLGLTQKGEAADRRRVTLKAQIAKIQGEEAKLAHDQATADARTVEHASQLLTIVQDVASAAFGIATAFLGADATLTKMIGSAVQVASSLSRIGELADQAGGIGKLFSSGAGIASALPAIGGVIGGVAGVASLLGDSPAEREQRELLRRNNERLEQLRQTLGDALKQTSAGRTIAGARRALNATPLPDTTARNFEFLGIHVLDQQLRKLGLTMRDLKQIAQDAGIELSDSPTLAQLRQLQKHLNEMDFAGFANSFAGAMDRLNAEFELFPDRFQSNVDRFNAILRELTNKTYGAPELFGDLAKIDTSTAEGKQAALAEIQRLFQLYADGKLTAEQLNGLNLDQFFATLLRLKTELGDLPQERTAAEQFAAALEAFGTAVELGSMTAEEKLAKAKDLFASLFPDLAASIDLTDIDSFKQSIQSIIDGFAADGELTAAEQAQISVLRLLLEAFGVASDEAANLAADLKQTAEAMRAFIFSLADAWLAVHDITDPVAILQAKAAALVQAFPELAETFAQFDLATQEGRDALEAWIQSLIDSPEALAAMAKELGISVDDLMGYLLGLESAADAAAAKVATLAERISGAFDEVTFGLNLEGITDPLEKLKRTVSGIAGVIPEIDQALAGLDLSTEEGRAKAEARLVALGKATTDTATRNAILNLLNLIRGVPAAAAPGAGAGDTSPTQTPSTTAQSGVQQLTERTGLQVTELQRLNNRQNEAMIALLARIADHAAVPDPNRLVQAPTLPAVSPGVVNTGTVVQLRVQNLFTGPISAQDAAVVEAGVEASVRAGLNKAFGADLQDIRTFRGGWPT